MRFIFGFIFIALYACWIIYRLIIKRDLKAHRSDFYALSFFAAAWLVIYYALFF